LVALDDLADLTAEEMKEIEEVGRKIHFRHYTVSFQTFSRLTERCYPETHFPICTIPPAN
jgi:hypothetical protein